ncbi:3-oxoacid CoA-transferase [Amycolatopsis pigmentata]|uniref:3-oxoacid CoA-transferase n=1 Tax=Amycolatopsis pigmentata TaxID=450801 RepID=A0ABW5FR37_9PSEU
MKTAAETALDKVTTAEKAVADVPDGASIAIVGFGTGHRFPSTLIRALVDAGPRNLCIVANSLGRGETSPESLALAGQVNRLIVSFSSRAGIQSDVADKIKSGEIALELVAQGILVERLRAAGAGLAGFYSPTAVGTELAEGKEIRTFNGREYVLEEALQVDYAFLRAYRADRSGNVQFKESSQNFNPSFAKGARVVIVEAEEIVERGEIAPEDIHLPEIFVTHVVPTTVIVKPGLAPAAVGRRAPDTRKTYFGKPALSRLEMAERAARLLPDSGYVNLGAGLPNLIAGFLTGKNIRLHAENGVLGYGGPVRDEAKLDADLFDAGGGFVEPLPGMSFFDSVTSFEIARSGRLSAVVLGGYQVDADGNLANWTTPGQAGGGIGGAMDLVASGSTLIVLMEHCDSKGNAKIVDRCTFPLTGQRCVDVVVTDLGVLRRDGDGFVLEDVVEGFTPEEVLGLTGLGDRGRISPDLTVLPAGDQAATTS